MSYMSAMDGVRMGVTGLQAGLQALTSPRVPLSNYYMWQSGGPVGVSAEVYNEVVAAHNMLVRALASEKRKSAQLQAQLRDALTMLNKVAIPNVKTAE